MLTNIITQYWNQFDNVHIIVQILMVLSFTAIWCTPFYFTYKSISEFAKFFSINKTNKNKLKRQ